MAKVLVNEGAGRVYEGTVIDDNNKVVGMARVMGNRATLVVPVQSTSFVVRNGEGQYQEITRLGRRVVRVPINVTRMFTLI